MNTTTLRLFHRSIAVVTLGAVLFGAVAFALPIQTATADDVDQSCSTLTLVSDSGTQTAGYTSVNPNTGTAALHVSSYSGSWMNATNTQWVSGWVDPATHATFSGTGAMWVSSSSTWPGGVGNMEGSATSSQWRLFRESFTLPVGAVATSATLYFTADNAAAVYQNGNTTVIATTDGTSTAHVYGPTPSPAPAHYGGVSSTTFTPVSGVNTLDFVVRNWSYDGATNPTGLLYKAIVNYCVPTDDDEQETVKVTLYKFLNKNHATGLSANNADFPMVASWSASNLGGAGSASFSLSENGYNHPIPYRARTEAMAEGSSYSVRETTTGPLVGARCQGTTTPYALVGYTSGNTLLQAMLATPTTTAPNFTNMQQNKHVIVWNTVCDGSVGEGEIGGDVTNNGILAVTSITAVDTTATADGTFGSGWQFIFNVTVPNSEPNVAMKFANWMSTVGSTTIPVANNIRISSMQASATSTILVTAANIYTTPDLVMTGDLNGTLPGKQVQIKVEVAVPVGTADGAYTTTYGIRSQ